MAIANQWPKALGLIAPLVQPKAGKAVCTLFRKNSWDRQFFVACRVKDQKYDRIARSVSEKYGQTKLDSNGAAHAAFEHDLIKLHKRELTQSKTTDELHKLHGTPQHDT